MAPLGQPLGDHRVDLGPLAGEDQQLLGVAFERLVEQLLDLSGAWMCAWWVAKAQYLQ